MMDSLKELKLWDVPPLAEHLIGNEKENDNDCTKRKTKMSP